VSERLDAVDLHARLWRAEDRIARHARSIASNRDLDPALAQRLEDAARDSDLDALLAALGDLLAEADDEVDRR
jgi:hypothetical protein